MKIVYAFFIGVILLSFYPLKLCASPSSLPLPSISKWLVYYGNEEKPSSFNHYDLVVLDMEYSPPFKYLINRETVLLSYLSLGEVSSNRSYFHFLKDLRLLLEENPFWPGSYFIDTRRREWKDFLIETLIPIILQKGYKGLFLDTLDNPAFLEDKSPKKYFGMSKSSIELVKTIRFHFPKIFIMVNRAYEILPEIASDIDLELAESLYTDYHFKEKTYFKNSLTLYDEQVAFLKDIQKKNPHLKLFSLDYWHPEDRKEIMKIYEKEEKNGFIPYVSDISLNKITPKEG